MTSGKFVHKSKLVQCRVEMAPEDVGFKKRRSVFRLKQKPGLAISHERVEQIGYPRVQVYLAIKRICFDGQAALRYTNNLAGINSRAAQVCLPKCKCEYGFSF